MLGRILTATLAAGLIGTTLVAVVIARSPSAPGYQLANVGPYGGEPSIVSDPAGNLYDATELSGGNPPLAGPRPRCRACGDAGKHRGHPQ